MIRVAPSCSGHFGAFVQQFVYRPDRGPQPVLPPGCTLGLPPAAFVLAVVFLHRVMVGVVVRPSSGASACFAPGASTVLVKVDGFRRQLVPVDAVSFAATRVVGLPLGFALLLVKLPVSLVYSFSVGLVVLAPFVIAAYTAATSAVLAAENGVLSSERVPFFAVGSWMVQGQFELATRFLATYLAPATAVFHFRVFSSQRVTVFAVRSDMAMLQLVLLAACLASTDPIAALIYAVFGREFVAVVAMRSDAARKIALPLRFSFLAVTLKLLLATAHTAPSLARSVVDGVFWSALVTVRAVRFGSSLARTGGGVYAPCCFHLALPCCPLLRSYSLTMDGASLGMGSLVALNTSAVPSGGQAGVLRRVLVTALAVGAIRAMVSTMAHDIAQVVGLGVPAQIAQPVVCRVAIDVAAERPLRGWADKRLKHHSVDTSSLLAPINVKRDHVIITGARSGVEYSATGGSHAAFVGHLETFKTDNGFPAFAFQRHNLARSGVAAGCQEPGVRPVPNGVQEVVRLGVPAKVCEPVIRRVTVVVAGYVPRRSRTDEGVEHDCVNGSRGGLAVFGQVDDGVAQLKFREAFNASGDDLSLPVALNDPSIQRTYLPLVGNFVQPFPAAYGQPLFALFAFIHSATRISAASDSS